MGRAATILFLGMSVTACGRYGFNISDGDVAFSADGPLPFGGAVPVGVELGVGGATLGAAVLTDTARFLPMPQQLPAPIMAAAARGFDEHIYVTGGAPGYTGVGCSDEILKYDPVGGALTLAQTRPSGHRGANLVLHPDGKLYSVMGYCDTTTDENAVFGFVPGTIGLEVAGGFIEGAYHAATAVLPDLNGDSLIVTAGGFGSGPLRDSVQTLDPRDKTAKVLAPHLPSKRCMATSAVVDDVMYVFGGNASSDVNVCEPAGSTTTPELTAQIIAVELNPERVEVVGSLPEPTAGACAVARADGTILIIGGARFEDPDGNGTFRREPTADIVAFDPRTGVAEVTAMTLPEPLSDVACASTASGRIIVMGGFGSDRVARDGIYAFGPYEAAGILLGPVIDSERRDARWVSAFWEAQQPAGTSVALYVRIGATDGWGNDVDGWVALETPGLLPEVLPRGRYMQWRAVLESPDRYLTPTLTEVSVHFQGP